MTSGSESGILATPMKAYALPVPLNIRLKTAQIIQVIILCVSVGLFIASIPINYEHRRTVCQATQCPPDQLKASSAEAMKQIGMSPDFFASLSVGFDILVSVAYLISAIVIFVRKPNDIFTIFVTIMLATFGTATFTGSLNGIQLVYPQLDWLVQTLAFIGGCSIIAFFFLFPNGHFTPRWTVLIFIAWIPFQLPRYYFPNSPLNLANSHPLLYNLLFPMAILVGIATQIYRYRRISNAVEQQQTKWVIYGLTIGLCGYLLLRLLSLTVPDPLGKDILVSLVLNISAVIFILLIPISITIAVTRYRLWDINPIINRTLVYGLLSAGTILFYILAVGFFSNYFQHRNANFIISFLATGVIAFLFEPVRERLQRGVNRLMYGESDDPATVLKHLSQRLDSTLTPDSVLQTIVETLAQTLRLPYAAISLLDEAQAPRFASTPGMSPSELIHLPLTYQTERVGELVLAPRAPGESFSTADMNLLNIIAGQAGIAVHNLRLTQDLQRSREKLVTAQEEERRRLRRDLHDGVGPTLASLSQRIDTAADLVNTNPQASVELLKDLKGQVKNTVAEIRRLVYALRPPVLDEFGLLTAIREHIAPYTGPNGPQVTFDVTDPLPPLPAAVEVAAYRIVLEAFTNIINHAEAFNCKIKIKVASNSLLLEITDNGKGLSPNHPVGVGLASMRERAAELGGDFGIENISPGGVCISARLPIHSVGSAGLLAATQQKAK